MNTNICLSDDLISLRPPQPKDISAIHTAVRESLAELYPWVDWATDAYDEASTQRWMEIVLLAWEHSSGFQFAITDAASGEYIGGCGLDGIDQKNHSCNLSYWVRTSRTGQGIASRAARLIARFAFETIGLLRAEIVIAAGNIASQHVAQKVGAHYEDTLPDHLVVHSTVYDAAIFSLTPKDFDMPG